MDPISLITLLAAVGTLTAALVAAITYRKNAVLERAKWSLNLYEKFYERESLKHIREIIDTEPDSRDVQDLVLKCPADFTDYLNFFEFVGFLEEKRQLTRDEVDALFDYYLKCLNRHSRVLKFIDENGYEYLSSLLRRSE